MIVGATLGNRYRILQPLGSGGFGDTYLAEDSHLPDHPKCVVKHLKPKDSDPRVIEVVQRLFRQEVKTLYQLGNQYEYIPKLFAHFEENGQFYLVQEFIDGHDLSVELTPGTQLSEEKVIQLLLEILSVLEGVHRSNIIHRDLKPQNIMRRRDGQLFLIDFGAVKEISALTIDPQGQTKLTISIGTRGYCPKEQAGGTPKLSSDIYAVGMIGIEALTGISPQALPEDLMTGEIIWRDRALNVSNPLAELLSTMVRYHFSERYPSAIEAHQALIKLVPKPKKTTRKLKQKIIAALACLSPVVYFFVAFVAAQIVNYFTSPATIESLIAIQPQFDIAYDFSSGLAAVKTGKQWNYVQKNGNVAISNLKFDGDIFAPRFSEGLAAIKLNGKWGYIDQSGNLVVQPKFDTSGDFSDGLASVEIDAKPVKGLSISIGGKWGHINRSGEFIIQPKFNYTREFSNGLAVVEGSASPTSNELFELFGSDVEKNRGYVDKTGNLAIPLKFKNTYPFSDELAVVELDSQTKGFIDTKGNLIGSVKLETSDTFHNGLLMAKGENNKKGYVDKTGRWAVQPKFDEASDFYEGLAAVKINDKWGYINKDGNFVVQTQFDNAKDLSEGLALVKKENKCSYINTSGKFITQALDVDKNGACPMSSFSEGLASVKINGKWGYIRNSLNK
ncbi:WG repeat-containing protein [Leptolyngbya sp. NIES-2104]|uniref:WG repeat-containing protein n=1 Tax=Leptolyngbya sp. NIES-2104 TaxID=1552121 RepID=UPI0006ECBC59|nr:WG repeat-containing protein [Leptolyngbya sp. NIES-2104]GAP96726.1 serine/threonine kinase [Leptolyngbya sp. NIES-2104]